MVEKNTLFDDPTVQIEDLTTIIKHQIDSIKKEFELLKVDQGRTNSFNKNKQSQNHWETLVQSLQLRLVETTRQFSSALKNRTLVIEIRSEIPLTIR